MFLLSSTVVLYPFDISCMKCQFAISLFNYMKRNMNARAKWRMEWSMNACICMERRMKWSMESKLIDAWHETWVHAQNDAWNEAWTHACHETRHGAWNEICVRNPSHAARIKAWLTERSMKWRMKWGMTNMQKWCMSGTWHEIQLTQETQRLLRILRTLPIWQQNWPDTVKLVRS